MKTLLFVLLVIFCVFAFGALLTTAPPASNINLGAPTITSGLAHLTGAAIACDTQNEFIKMVQIANDHDETPFKSMMITGGGPCMPFKEGTAIYVVETNGIMTKIRLEGTTLEAWTASKMVQP